VAGAAHVRLATVEEVANMVVCVGSLQASATTGAALRVDPGVVQTRGLAARACAFHQVRQAVLLVALYEDVASGPIESFLHRINELDTLGDDEPETPCHWEAVV
jgi:hypothetical protein